MPVPQAGSSVEPGDIQHRSREEEASEGVSGIFAAPRIPLPQYPTK